MIIKKIDHVHLLVGDLDKTARAFERVLGLTPWEFGIRELGFGRQTMLTPRDGARIELVQLKSDTDRMYKKFKECGDGIYGLSVFIENFDDEIEKLKVKGVAVEEVKNMMLHGKPFKLAWVPPSEGQGVWLELVDANCIPEFEKNWETED